MERSQFTCYRSFYEAIRKIKKAADRAAAYDVLMAYALDGIEPDMDKLPDSVAICFLLVKPTLDTSRNKAANRMNKSKSNQEQTENKTEQTVNKKEKEKENKNKKENESEREKESYNPLTPLQGSSELQAAFSDWLKYKSERRQGYKPTGLQALVTEVQNNVAKYGEAAVIEIITKSMASGWVGICFDKLKENATKQRPPVQQNGNNVFLSLLEEEGL
jgi:hypothetical protein